MERNESEQLANLEHAAGIPPREPPEIHQYDVAVIDQRGQHGFPRVVVAEKIVHTVAAVPVRADVHLPEPALERAGSVDEPPRQPAGHEIEEFVRLDGARGQVDAGDHLDAPDASPVLLEGIEQALAGGADRE